MLDSAEQEDFYEREDYKEHRTYDLSLDERFEVTLFASPPQVEYVTAVSADIDGTVYVSVDPNGSLGHIEGVGKIVTAKDTDGDGKADEFKDFVPMVQSPRGGHIVAGTYYLLHPPYLSTYKDTDGDGVMDVEKTLMKGFGGGIEHPRGADHTTNGVRMGIDGWLYVSVGDFGMFDVVGTDGRVVRLQGGGVARCRPDGTELEVYVYHTRNQFDVAISPLLELFTRDNTNDGAGWNLRIHHLVAESDMGYPRLYENFPDEHLASLADFGGGSGMGGLFLDEPGFPVELNNRLYTCDWTSGKVFGFDMTPHKGTYAIKQTVLTDLERATDIDVDGRSNLYLADWKGGRFNFANGKPVGRIHMAKLKGYQAPAVPNLKTAKPLELVDWIAGPSASIRLQAQQYLLQKELSKAVIEKLKNITQDKSVHLHMRVAALFTLKQGMGAKSHAFFVKLLADATIRAYALKALADRKSQLANISPEVIAEHLADSDPKVRLQATIALRRLNKFSKPATEKLIQMAVAEWDSDSVGELGTLPLPHLASRALASLGQNHQEARRLYLEAFKAGDVAVQKALSYALNKIYDPELVQAMIIELGAKQWSDESRLIILGILARLSHQEKEWDVKSWWGTRPNDKGPYYKAVKWDLTPAIIAAIEKNFTRFNAESQLKVLDLFALNQISASSLKLEGVDTVFSALEASRPTPQHINVLASVAADAKRPWLLRVKAAKKLFIFQDWRDHRPYKIRQGELSDKAFKKAKQKAAIRLQKKQDLAKIQRLLAVKALIDILGQWSLDLAEDAVPKEQVRGINALINDYWTAQITHSTDVTELFAMVNGLSDSSATLAWKKILFSSYRISGQRQLNAAPLIKDKEAIRNPGYYRAIEDLYLLDDKFIARTKEYLDWDNIAVREATADIMALYEAKLKVDKDPLKGLSVTQAGMDKAAAYALEHKGDVALGAKLFNRQSCITCHAVNNAAQQKGPYLGAAGSQFKRDFLIESVLNPGAVIAQGFPTYTLKNKGNRGRATAIGFLVNEDNTNYYLMNIAGHNQTVMRERLASKEMLQISQMPPGLVQGLSLHEFASLIEFLVSMK